MKVLHAIYSVENKWGGTVEALRQLISALHRQFPDSTHEVVSLDHPESDEAQNFETKVYPKGPGLGFYGYSTPLPRWLQENCDLYDTAVIHGCWQYHGIALSNVFRKKGKPYLLYPHGMIDPWFKRKYPLKHLKKVPYWRLVEHKIFKHANRVIFTTKEEKKLSKQPFRPYHVNAEVVPLGIVQPDINEDRCINKWKSKMRGLKSNPYLLFMSRIHEKKGVDLLVEASIQINSSGIDVPEFNIVIAGPCKDPSFLEKLKKQSQNLPKNGPIKNIHWSGMIQGEEKWGALAGADAFILPSHQENFGMVVPESLSCGTPVLISNKVNIWNEVASSGAGLVENDDLNGTVELIRKWTTLGEVEKTKFREASEVCFKENFMIDANARKLHEILQKSID